MKKLLLLVFLVGIGAIATVFMSITQIGGSNPIFNPGQNETQISGSTNRSGQYKKEVSTSIIPQFGDTGSPTIQIKGIIPKDTLQKRPDEQKWYEWVYPVQEKIHTEISKIKNNAWIWLILFLILILLMLLCLLKKKRKENYGDIYQ